MTHGAHIGEIKTKSRIYGFSIIEKFQHTAVKVLTAPVDHMHRVAYKMTNARTPCEESAGQKSLAVSINAEKSMPIGPSIVFCIFADTDIK